MSMDHFMEEVVVKRKNTVNRIVYALSWAVLVFSVFLAMMSFSGIMGQGGFNIYALVTTLVSKDRVMAHNTVGALYQADKYLHLI